RVFVYCFRPPQPGGSKPEVELHPIDGAFRLGSLTCTPIPVWHGQMPVTGWRIGRVAYVTDASRIPAESLALLEDLDVLVLGALRFRPHPTHMSIGEALSVIADLKPRQAYLTHLSHNVDHARTDQDMHPSVNLANISMSVTDPKSEYGT